MRRRLDRKRSSFFPKGHARRAKKWNYALDLLWLKRKIRDCSQSRRRLILQETGFSDDRKYVGGGRLYACINYTKIKGLDSGKITSLPNSRKLTACSPKDSFAYNESLQHPTSSSPGLFPQKMGGAGKGPGIGWSRVPSYTLKSWV